MRKILAAALAAGFVHSSAWAAALPADGYVYSRELLSQFTEGCVAEGRGGVFVGVGPLMSYPPTRATRSVVFVSDAGTERTVATGLNAIGDCYYDRSADTLYVSDNGGDFAGAVTGDTLFAIASASSATSLNVAGRELVAAGSIPFASSLARLGSDLLVSDAAGSGNGRVLAISLDTAPPLLSSFAAGLDYAGGLTIDGSEVLVAESRSATFDNEIRRYDSSGVLLGLMSGPTYAHGSIDLALEDGGNVLVTGNDTVVAVEAGATTKPMVTGLDGGTGYAAFGGGISIDAASGRIDFAASSFSAADDDRGLHRLTPVSHLVAGRGRDDSECLSEFYGVSLVAAAPGRTARLAICEDGAECDADGEVNDSCTFALGFCLNVADSRFPACASAQVDTFELLAAKPQSAALVTAAAAVQAAAPLSAPACFFSDGITVPLRVAAGGPAKVRNGRVKVRVRTAEPAARSDTDVVRLQCRPPAI